MGKPAGKAPAAPPSYHDDPDAVSLHTTPDDYNYDDAPELPSYSDSEAAASTSHYSAAGADAPQDEYAIIPESNAQGWRTSGKLATRNTTTIRMDERLNDPDALYDYITNYLRIIPPKPSIRIHGWHTNRNNNKKETERRVDFDISFSLADYLPEPRLSADPEEGWQPRVPSNSDRIHRGSWRKTRAPGYKQDVEVGEEAQPDLMHWCKDFCASPASLKIFRITREVPGLDQAYLRTSLERLVRSTNYRGHVDISFPIEDKNVDIYSPHRVNRWRITTWMRWLFYLTFLWLFTWPILYFVTKRWGVYTVNWCFSWLQDNGPGPKLKVYIKTSEQCWISKHGELVKGLAVERFQGDATDLPVHRGVGEARPGRNGRLPSTGNANVDAAVNVVHGVVDILILISFFTVLWLLESLSAKVIRAGIIGPIAAGIIYGRPLSNILHHDWQETFLALGYIGLILLIFEGGLKARLDLLRANLVLSICAAATGIVFPIALSFLLLYLGFGYGAVETFIIGAALSDTSLGTTFAVISGAAKTVDLSQTRVGAVLVSAAVIDDVSGLVMSSVISDLGQTASGEQHVNLGWLIARPIVASIAMAVLTPLSSKLVLAPGYRRWFERNRFVKKNQHISNIALMILVLCAFLAIAAYAGTSVLFGAFLAGMFLSYIPLPSKHSEAASQEVLVLNREVGEEEHRRETESKTTPGSPTFVHTFEYYFLHIQKSMLEPLFFASIGFAIPFLDLWTGSAIWHGVVYTLLMMVGKMVVGLWVPMWALLQPTWRGKAAKTTEGGSDSGNVSPMQSTDERHFIGKTTRIANVKAALNPGVLLGMAMVARGEIGLLIVEIGFNNTSYVSHAGFVTAIWAILLNTILGPVAVGVLVKYRGEAIGADAWGVVSREDEGQQKRREKG